MLLHRLLIVTFALTFYCLGTTYFEAFVNYRTWAFIGAAEFPSYHRALTPLVARVMLLPIAIYVACLVALVLRAGALVPRWAVAVSLALVLVAVASSLLVQIPIQRAFDRDGLSGPLLRRLIITDLALRKIPLGLNAFLWLAMFWRHTGATLAGWSGREHHDSGRHVRHPADPSLLRQAGRTRGRGRTEVDARRRFEPTWVKLPKPLAPELGGWAEAAGLGSS